MVQQPIKNKKVTRVKKNSHHKAKKASHPKYGTSKLEEKFAKEFLDKLGVPYEKQFEAKDIGRFYDFKVGERVLVEVDGDYW